MRAAWWWIDRWRKSTAYTDMTAEAQGIYRNLLDELWLRGGVIPNDERILAKIGGDAEAWSRVRAVVLARFRVTPEGLRNDTHDEVSAWPAAQAEKGKKRAASARRVMGRFASPAPAVNQPESPAQHQPPSPSPSPSPLESSIEVGREVVEPRRNEQPPRLPADIAEASVLNEIRKLQNELAGRLARLSEHPNSREMVPSWSRRSTSYTRKDGTKVQGVSDYRTISSIERLERSIADADRWLQRLDEGPLEEAKSGIR